MFNSKYVVYCPGLKGMNIEPTLNHRAFVIELSIFPRLELVIGVFPSLLSS